MRRLSLTHAPIQCRGIFLDCILGAPSSPLRLHFTQNHASRHDQDLHVRRHSTAAVDSAPKMANTVASEKNKRCPF